MLHSNSENHDKITWYITPHMVPFKICMLKLAVISTKSCASIPIFIKHLSKIQFIKDLSHVKANKNTAGNRKADLPLWW